jgi:hypothetical protein
MTFNDLACILGKAILTTILVVLIVYILIVASQYFNLSPSKVVNSLNPWKSSSVKVEPSTCKNSVSNFQGFSDPIDQRPLADRALEADSNIISDHKKWLSDPSAIRTTPRTTGQVLGTDPDSDTNFSGLRRFRYIQSAPDARAVVSNY